MLVLQNRASLEIAVLFILVSLRSEHPSIVQQQPSWAVQEPAQRIQKGGTQQSTARVHLEQKKAKRGGIGTRKQPGIAGVLNKRQFKVHGLTHLDVV